MHSYRVKISAGVALLTLVIGTAVIAQERTKMAAELSGYEEIPTLSTSAEGMFHAVIDRNVEQIRYELSYAGPFDANPAGGTVQQAHIHLGAPAFNGGIIAFLCTNLGNGPAGTPACPAEGTVTGTITPADVVGPAGQGIQPGQFAKLVEALRAGAAYANVHTTTFSAGEIRGQIGDHDRGHDK